MVVLMILGLIILILQVRRTVREVSMIFLMRYGGSRSNKFWNVDGAVGLIGLKEVSFLDFVGVMIDRIIGNSSAGSVVLLIRATLMMRIHGERKQRW
jgi:F0F1-type ATP synthase assembly protein I